MSNSVHFNLDDAWPTGVMEIITRDLRQFGPGLRYLARAADMEAFAREIEGETARFVLYGSGDFHHLAAVLLRRIDRPVNLISFDNHPDWDVRPPKWACGGWINRALQLPHVRRVSVWGCGNFEMNWPARIFANHAALRSGRLEVMAWVERCGAKGAMTRENWREKFEAFCAGLDGQEIYVTVDLDCLRAEAAVTNWEQGLFSPEDLVWAIGQLRGRARVVAGDVCGAYSPARYARRFQRFAGAWDHPKLAERNIEDVRRINAAALQAIWPALTA
ncbi:MAG: hypothetical protein QOF78_2291 [Phycisphaerales bacterium]|jgi:arginase family enzyme|nr:hypothetical protein [Phycisphaerales bacterium]